MRNNKKIKICNIISIVLIFLIIVMLTLYKFIEMPWMMLVACIAILLLIVLSVFCVFVTWLWDIQDLMTEYKEKDNLISGGLALVGVFSIVIIILLILSNIESFSQAKDFFEVITSFMVVIMPALMGLLGVQYSVAIQEKNRKEDIRLGAKPFFRIQCCKIEDSLPKDDQESLSIKIKIVISNISQNIGIPTAIILCDNNQEIALSYTILANNDTSENIVEIEIIDSLIDTVKFSVIYNDIYKNTYETKVDFLLDKSETQIISDELSTKKYSLT